MCDTMAARAAASDTLSETQARNVARAMALGPAKTDSLGYWTRGADTEFSCLGRVGCPFLAHA